MKNKLIIAVASVISVVSIAATVVSCANENMAKSVPENTICECVPVNLWPKTLS